MPDLQFDALEQKIDDLISLCTELNQENISLKSDAAQWQSERQQLVQRNQEASTKVESIIDRLRTMEQSA